MPNLNISFEAPDPATPARRCVALRGAMTIYEAAAAKEALIEALQGAGELDIDLAGVAEVDVAGLQLLVLLRREARGRECRVRLSAHSAATREAIDRLNLGPCIDDGKDRDGE